MRTITIDLSEKDVENLTQCIELVIIEMDVNSTELFELQDKLNKALKE